MRGARFTHIVTVRPCPCIATCPPPQALPGQCRFQPLDASKVGLAVGTSPRRKGGETIRHQARPGSLPAQLRARTPNTPPKSLPKAFSAIRPTAPFRQNCPTSRLAVVPGACILKHFCREPSGAPACGAERWLAGSGGCGRSRRRRRRPRGRRERRPEGPKLTPDEQQGRRQRRPEGPKLTPDEAGRHQSLPASASEQAGAERRLSAKVL